MTMRLLTFLLLPWLLLACQPIRPPQPNQPGAPSDIFALNQQLGRGVNLGNTLEAPNYEGEWGMRLDAGFFTLIAEAGFTNVRVPIRWSAHADAEAPYTIEETFFERIDWVIAQAKANGLLVIVNMHHYEEMISDPDRHRTRFLALWEQIAERYKEEPPTLLFELLNEPNGALTVVKWNKILADGIAVVRRSNPTRAIIVGPVQWNNIGFVGTLHLPTDPNLIVTFHYYDPFQFTHQGAEWVDGASGWLGTTWAGNGFEQQAITSAFATAATWAKAQNRPLFMGEFGTYSKADLPSRKQWTTFVAQSAVERGISFAYWEFGAGFGVYDRARGEWNQGLVDALLK